MSNQVSNDSQNNVNIDTKVEILSQKENNQIDIDLSGDQNKISENFSNASQLNETDENNDIDNNVELENECDCCECRIRQNSDFSTEQLPLDTQLPITLMSESFTLCTIL
jgi:hypothetical protein